MGDISGRPKAPEPQVVYVPQYVYTNTAGNGSSSTSVNNDPTTTPTPEQQREKNLLSRARSRLGTVLTGFRGILAPSESQGQHKTLLGE